MSKKIYDLMNWAEIEEVVYGEAQHPNDILGAKNIGRNTLVQCFFPGAKAVSLITEKGENIKMEQHDEAGFFAMLLPGKDRRDYKYHVTGSEKNVRPKDINEVYTGKELLTEAELDLIMSGSDTHIGDKLGSHVVSIDGRKGVRFAVWAPNAKRVSVVGDFNDWNGLAHQMERNERTGIYTLFIPGLGSGEKYKYEILIAGPETIVKPDPYAKRTDGTDENASLTGDIASFKWTDAEYLKSRKVKNFEATPFNIYEINAEAIKDGKGLKAATKSIIAHMKSFGYTHADLMPVMQYADDNSSSFIPSSCYAVNGRIGGEEELMYFVNALHEEGLGVILQYSAFCFDSGKGGISYFDGTCLYEHQDYRKGVDPRTGAKLYRFGEEIVDEFVLSNVIYFRDTFHLDGIKFTDVSAMLYLDYFRNDNEWIPNIYGGNENLEAIKFIRKMNKILHECSGFITIAEEKSGWPFISLVKGLSEKDKSECLGFDFVMNNGFNEDMISYISNDPIERFRVHDELTLSSIYQYRENYISYVSHENVINGVNEIVSRIPGTIEEKAANLRALYGYMMMMPGKKEFFMNQDEAPFGEDNESLNKAFAVYMKDILKMVSSRNCLSKYDFEARGFEWINNFSANENVFVFTRKADKKDEQLTIVVNFANTLRDRYRIGVPEYGKYREVFSSADVKYGGAGALNDKAIASKKKECDARENSILVKLAPLSISVFSYAPYTKAELETMEKKRIAREKDIEERLKKREKFMEEKKKLREEMSAELKKKVEDIRKKYK